MSMTISLSIVVITATDIGMEENGRVRRSGRRLVLAAAQDSSDGFVGARVEQERTRAGGVDALRSVALDEPRIPMAERKPCSGCGRERRMTSIRASASGPMLA